MAKILKCDNSKCGKEQEAALGMDWIAVDRFSLLSLKAPVEKLLESRVDTLNDMPDKRVIACSRECLHAIIDWLIDTAAARTTHVDLELINIMAETNQVPEEAIKKARQGIDKEQP